MIKLAVIGTNWITQSFINGALKTGKFALTAVYSRQKATAQAFAKEYQTDAEIHCFDDFEGFCYASDFDAVYIASPNSFHAPQAIALLNAGKHVICEKPLGSHIAEVEAMYQAAEQSGTVLFEAYKAPYLPNFKQIKANLEAIKPIHRGHLSYCQLSSRYAKYLAGENPNTFNPQFSNGSTMDIGYYCFAAAAELFGEPNAILASGEKLASGVDAHGSAILKYDGFEILVSHSKVSDGFAPSDIQGEQGTLSVAFISDPTQVTLHRKGEDDLDLTQATDEWTMRYEAEHFASQIEAGEMDASAVNRSKITARILTEVRRQVGVVFPADSVG
ncbi:Gfo/Idh/MocA family oxidoreductase [Vibrio sp. SCSIO 43136]|uniref:Gfo/Idh/MocA family protein n=1 Tax=Vibrio sp. SCSIO 43136 TaxID=2819101 RepID=UPI002074BD08|nr:Gfo/Idh/MocA family oxidoreductase [Vibrio sp. SCSIO 43136]USD67820.1 Gfo/Idh/MocA family oxidoreductase [Vibrio sp. SCSIO 43136]